MAYNVGKYFFKKGGIYNMLHMIPDDMEQVEEKLAWMKQNGYEQTTKQDVINDMTKDGVQDMLDTALEGPYWTARWKEAGQLLKVCGPVGDVIGTLKPRDEYADFESDLENNAILFWRNLATQTQKLIGHD